MGQDISTATGSPTPENTTPPLSTSLASAIDSIATHYILTQNFKDMKNLTDSRYCEELSILTSDIIAKYLNNLQVEYLATRVGVSGEETKVLTKNDIVYLKKRRLDNLDTPNEPPTFRKKKLCDAIAKFYVKISHIFAAIQTTLNPVYTYRSEYGDKIEVPIEEKERLPKDFSIKLDYNNLCSKRLNALLNGNDYKVSDEEIIKVNPNFCTMNQRNTSDGRRDKTKRLTEEPGIPELKFLYNDQYDPENRDKYHTMSKEMRKIYEADVETFYVAFTGNKAIPVDSDGKKTITEFSQIKLRNFQDSEGCSQEKHSSDTKSSVPNQHLSTEQTHIMDQIRDINMQMPQLDANVANNTANDIELDAMKERTELQEELSLHLEDNEPDTLDGVAGSFSRSYSGTLKDTLFKKYAQQIIDMQKTTKANQDLLLPIIDQLFVFSVNPETDRKKVVINPLVTQESLQGIVENTRKIIVQLYLQCEEDFMKALQIFEAIVANQIQETTEKQISALEHTTHLAIAQVDLDHPSASSSRGARSVVSSP